MLPRLPEQISTIYASISLFICRKNVPNVRKFFISSRGTSKMGFGFVLLDARPISKKFKKCLLSGLMKKTNESDF